MKKWSLILFVILLLGIPTAIRVNRSKKEVRKEESAVPVVVTIPKMGNVIKVMSFSSKIKGIDQAAIYPDLMGRFLRFTVEDGQRVREGEIIAYIELEIPGVERKPISVESPISGVISLSPLDRGEPITQQVPIAQVARVDRVKVEFDVPEKFHLKKGTPIKVDILSLNKKFKGEIIKASAFYNPKSRTQRVQGIIQNPDNEIIPGMFARVWVEVARESNVVTISPDAIIGTAGKYVYIARGGLSVEAPVVTGLEIDSLVSIREGVALTDTIIIVGQYIVKDSARIDIKEVR